MNDTPNLNAAMLAARADFGPLERKGDNTFLKVKYVKLDDLLDAITPALDKAGLLLEQETGTVVRVDAQVRREERKGDTQEPASDPVLILTVKTRLIHVASGEVREHVGQIPFTPERGISLPQSLGKAITYLRRYALTAMFGITTEDDVDAQPAQQRQQAQRQQPRPQQSASGEKTISNKDFVDAWNKFYPDADKSRARLDELGGWDKLKGNGVKLARILADEVQDRVIMEDLPDEGPPFDV